MMMFHRFRPPHPPRRPLLFPSRPLTSQPLDLFVSCLPGLERSLSFELKRRLGIPNSATEGGVFVRSGSAETVHRIHLCAGLPSHVLIRCDRAFPVKGFPELLRRVARMDWHRWIDEDATLQIRVKAVKSKLHHTGAIAERIERGVDRALGRSSDTSSRNPDKVVPLTVRLVRDIAQVSIDTSTTPIHQRGYRLASGKAPLREDIAYAMAYASLNSHLDSQRNNSNNPLTILDPFCGSGTIPIEACQLLHNLPPGRLREAPLAGTKFYNRELWEALRTEHTRDVSSWRDSTPVTVWGGDRDAGVIASAQQNAARAGVESLIQFSNLSLSDSFDQTTSSPLHVITNPPFGKRIAPKSWKERRTHQHLWPLYQTLGQKVVETQAASAVILCNDRGLVRQTALRGTETLFATDHGGVKVQATGYRVLNTKDEKEAKTEELAV